MKSPHRALLIAAGMLGLTGVALGAFGTHGLRTALESTGKMDSWKTAVLYQLIHAVALLALTNWPNSAVRIISICWICGVVLFSGSLYCLALGGPARFLWPLTPLGGLALLAGWLAVIWAAFSKNNP